MRTLGIWLMLGGLAASRPAWADTLRCGSGIVSTGDESAEVLATCGTPAYRDPWLFYAPRAGNYVADEEEWYYDFGSTQLLRILRFRHGRLVDIETDGYGYGAPPSGLCGPTTLVSGLSKYRLLLLCGEPLTRQSYGVLRPLVADDGSLGAAQRLQSVYREKWVYNFGSRHFLHRVTLENGRVVDVETGDRGFGAD